MKTVKGKTDASKQMEIDFAFAKVMQGEDRVRAEAAFTQLYMRYKRNIHFMALKFAKNNQEIAEDMVQEIFNKVWEKRMSYNGINAFSTWLFNIASNHLKDMVRKRTSEVLSIESLKSEFSGDEDFAESFFQIEDKSSDTFLEVIKQERAQAVRQALDDLGSDKKKQVMTLLYLNDMSFEEVSKHMEMPQGTVKALMVRAKAEMKEFLSRKKMDFNYAN